MKEVLKISTLADLEMYAMLQPSLEALFKKFGFDEKQATMLVIAAEEVFAYCVKRIHSVKSKSRIAIGVILDNPYLLIIIEHDGPRGSLEKHLMEGSEKKIERTSFEALGLYIAREVIDELRYTGFWGGKNEFTLMVKFPESAKA